MKPRKVETYSRPRDLWKQNIISPILPAFYCENFQKQQNWKNFYREHLYTHYEDPTVNILLSLFIMYLFIYPSFYHSVLFFGCISKWTADIFSLPLKATLCFITICLIFDTPILYTLWNQKKVTKKITGHNKCKLPPASWKGTCFLTPRPLRILTKSKFQRMQY